MQTQLRLIFCLLLVAVATVVLVKIVTAEANGGSHRLDGQCDPILRLSEFFDGVTPPALPSGWSSTTWVTSDSGVPTPPADTLPNAVFVDDPATISDKPFLHHLVNVLGHAVNAALIASLTLAVTRQRAHARRRGAQ